MGDDLPDLPPSWPSAWRLAPPTLSPKSRKRLILITKAHGGNGTIREIVEIILKSQGKWSNHLSVIGGAPLLTTAVGLHRIVE